jgi:ankyrin repeat protein
MRLLQRKANGDLIFHLFNKNVPKYAILSHTWYNDNNSEVTLQDVEKGLGKSKAGYHKIEFCAKQAEDDGLEFFWIDTCCIDKKDAVELGEAINSMFRWYQNADRCYVYLPDVSINDDETVFGRSRWFTRGWTLQELIAPSLVEFFSKEGKRIGEKRTLGPKLQEITNIPIHALQGRPLSQFSTETRMSWAKQRQTTKDEDQAYCLLGIFGIHLPLIYGEGKDNALRRLNNEIDKYSKESECLHALRTTAYEEFKDRNPDRLEGTCQWFLHHDYFPEWQQRPSSLLWVSADPGCGKSVLAKSLIRRELKPTESRLTCYYFFKDDNEKQKNITDALSALLHQLFSQRRSLIHHAVPSFTTEGAKLTESFHKLWSVFMSIAADSTAGDIVYILDALDECAEEGRCQIIEALSRFYKQEAAPSSSSRCQLKFLVTSRPYLDIERRFTTLTSIFPTIRLQGEQESEAISREIVIVIKSRVKELGRELKLDISEQSTLEQELLRMEHHTYLWLKLILDLIRDEISLTKRKLKQIVSAIPATLDQAYEAILSRIREKNREKARKLLRIVVASARPLTLREMNIALSMENHHQSYDDLDLPEEERFRTTVRHLCGLFVTVIDQKIYLIHQTAKEFLLTNNEPSIGRWKQSLTLFDSELLVAKICITYLNFTVFDDGSVESEPVTQNIKNHGLLGYAASFWATHYRQTQSRATTELLQSVLFLYESERPRYRNWIRANGSKEWIPRGPHCCLLLASHLAHVAVVKKLLQCEDIDVNAKEDGDGRTALICAAKVGNAAVLKELLQCKDVDVNAKDQYGLTALMWATQHGYAEAVKELLQREDVHVNAQARKGRTALIRAAQGGYAAVVKELLQRKDIDVNAEEEEYRMTALIWATQHGYAAVVRELLQRKDVDVNTKAPEGRTVLLRATQGGYAAVIKELLQRKDIDVNANTFQGITALIWAAEDGNAAVVKELLQRKDVDVNAKEERYGMTALICAAQHGHAAVVNELLQREGIDVNTENSEGRTALLLAAGYGNATVVRELLQHKDTDVNAKEKEYGLTALIAAIMCRNATVVKELLQRKDVDVNVKDNEGTPALIWAADDGEAAMVKELLQRKDVDMNAREEEHGRTALILAARGGHTAVIKEILQREDINVNAKDKYGWTALIRAAWDGRTAVVKELLERKDIDVNAKMEGYGRTALMWATGRGKAAVVKELLRREDVDVNAKEEKYGRTALIWAAGDAYVAVVKELLKRKDIDVNARDEEYSRTALIWAARGGYEVVVRELLRREDINVNAKDRYGCTALIRAARDGQVDVVKELLKRKDIDVNAKMEEYGRTALIWAARGGHAAVIMELLQREDINLTAKERYDWTALIRDPTAGMWP